MPSNFKLRYRKAVITNFIYHKTILIKDQHDLSESNFSEILAQFVKKKFYRRTVYFFILNLGKLPKLMISYVIMEILVLLYFD